MEQFEHQVPAKAISFSAEVTLYQMVLEPATFHSETSHPNRNVSAMPSCRKKAHSCQGHWPRSTAVSMLVDAVNIVLWKGSRFHSIKYLCKHVGLESSLLISCLVLKSCTCPVNFNHTGLLSSGCPSPPQGTDDLRALNSCTHTDTAQNTHYHQVHQAGIVSGSVLKGVL